jgi:hypothetical protein
MHMPGRPARWTRPAAWAAVLLAPLLACSGGGKVNAVATDGGGDGPASTAGSFPFSGPTCTGPAYNLACWQCVQRTCPATETCLTADCNEFFTCYCSCALGDTGCQQSCEGALSMTCQACAQSVTNCQKQSCPSYCETDGG